MEKLKFLIIRFSSIGDIVLTSPVMRHIKEKYPDCELHFATKKKFKTVVEHNPRIDVLHLLDDDLNEFVDEIKKIKFDYVIDLHNSIRSVIVRNRLNVKSRRNIYHLNKLNFRKFLFTTFKIMCMPDIHYTDREVDTLKALGVTNDKKGLEYYVSPDDEAKAKELTAELSGGYVAFVTGATYYTKRMTADMIAEIADNLSLPVVLLGGPTDVEASNFIMANCHKNNVINMCAKVSLNVSAAIVKFATLVIAHDTGLMHIAAAFKKDIVTVWGNTIHELGMYACEPGKNSVDFEVKNLKCRPCSKLGYHSCPKKHFNCMNLQDRKAIINKSNEIIALNCGSEN